MSDNIEHPDDNSTPSLVILSAIEWRAKRPHYGGKHYPVPPWHEECLNGDPVIQSEFDFARYAAQVHALYPILRIDEWGLLRLDVKQLAVECVKLRVEADDV